MIIIDLIKQDRKKNFRAQGFYKSLSVKLLMGFMGLYFAVIFLSMGYFLGDMLDELDGALKPLELFNGATLYILMGALMLRFFMQSLNTLNLQTYQALPIKRSTLVNFLLLKPVFAIGNYLTLLVVIPFAIRSVAGYYSAATAVTFILNCIMLIWFDLWLATWLKRRFGSSLMALLVVLVVVGGFVALEYYKVFSLFGVSMQVFNYLSTATFGWLITLLFAALAYGLNLWFFSRNYYPEKFNEKLKLNDSRVTGGFSFLDRFGITGELISLQVRLMFRHKRTKTLLYLSAFFLVYGLLFYTNPIYKDQPGWLFFCAMFMTGILMLMYGQWVFSWESSYFDSILTKNIQVDTYIRSNYYLLVAFNVISFVLTTPYFFFGTKIILLHIAAFLFNTGVNIMLLIFFGTFNTKRIDLNARSSFNYQGTTFKSFLIIMPIMFLPMIVVGVVSSLASMNAALIVLGVSGLLGIIFKEPLLKLCISQFRKRKYAMANGFREIA